MRNFSTKQKVWILLGILLLGTYVFFDVRAAVKSVYDSLTLEVCSEEIEYGSSFEEEDLRSYEGDLTIEGEVDTMTVGDYPVTYTLSKKEEKYAIPVRRVYEVTYHVADTKPPVIELAEEEISIYTNAEYDLADNVARVYDEVDGEIKDWTVETEADLSAPGDYEVTVSAIDRNGLSSSASYVLHVKQRPAMISSAGYRTIYSLLRDSYGYNKAAACAILANIKFESSFSPSVDDGAYFGLIQWGGGRRNRLFAWCSENGLDAYSIEGQLAFMDLELSSAYAGVKNYLLNIDDSADGAYNAAVYFSDRYEAAASHAGRGELAYTYFEME